MDHADTSSSPTGGTHIIQDSSLNFLERAPSPWTKTSTVIRHARDGRSYRTNEGGSQAEPGTAPTGTMIGINRHHAKQPKPEQRRHGYKGVQTATPQCQKPCRYESNPQVMQIRPRTWP